MPNTWYCWPSPNSVLGSRAPYDNLYIQPIIKGPRDVEKDSSVRRSVCGRSGFAGLGAECCAGQCCTRFWRRWLDRFASVRKCVGYNPDIGVLFAGWPAGVYSVFLEGYLGIATAFDKCFARTQVRTLFHGGGRVSGYIARGGICGGCAFDANLEPANRRERL